MLGYTHTVSHTQICSDTLTWMYVVTQTHSKAHTHNFTYTQFYIHMRSYTDTHPCAYTVTHNCIHTHTHSQQAHTLASVGMEPGSRHSVLCHSSGQQMPLLSLLSPDVTIMVGGWIPLSTPPQYCLPVASAPLLFPLSLYQGSKAVAGRQRAEPLCQHSLVPRLLTRSAGPP